MRSDAVIDDVVNAIIAGEDGEVSQSIARLLALNLRPSPSWIVVAFTKSNQAPIARILPTYHVATQRDEQLLQRGPFAFAQKPPEEPRHLPTGHLRKLAGQRLAQLFPEGALYVPVPSTALASQPCYAGAILLGAREMPNIDSGTIALAQLGMSIVLAERDLSEAERRLDEEHFASLSRSLMDCKTRRDACAAVLECIDHFIPFQAGVLYLVDPDPGRNEYLIYGASRNENQRALYRSFYPREDLGFTWEVAMSQKPKAGSRSDVPIAAKRTNDAALKHLKQVHEAWALVPLTSHGQTRAVVHIEGVNFGDGASGADLEIMRRLVGRLGAILHRALNDKTSDDSDRPSIQIIEKLYGLLRSTGQDRHRGFENLIRYLFSSLDGIQEVQILDESRTAPQIDGLFLFKDPASSFVVEVKAPERDNSPIGVLALRQLVHQMEVAGGSLGILVSMGRFSSRTKAAVTRQPILILDRTRVERMCALSPEDRKRDIARWLSLAKPGVHFADVS